MDKELRLDKFLADMGKGTRSALKEAVRKGRVRVNGEVIKKADIKVRIPGDTVTLDGEEVAYAVMEYYMLNKPQGVVSATEDKKYPTVLDLIADKKGRTCFRWDGWTWIQRAFSSSPMTETWPTGSCHPKSMWTRYIMPAAAER